MEYASGLPSAVADALGNRSRMVYDGIGRVIEAIDPLQNSTRIEYDALGRPKKTVDAMFARTEFFYL